MLIISLPKVRLNPKKKIEILSSRLQGGLSILYIVPDKPSRHTTVTNAGSCPWRLCTATVSYTGRYAQLGKNEELEANITYGHAITIVM